MIDFFGLKLLTQYYYFVIILYDFQSHAQNCSRQQYDQNFPCAYGQSSGFIDYRAAGKCLQFHKDQVTWRQANTRCQEQGSRLVRMLDNDEIVELRNTGWRSNYWIGLNDIDEEGTFVWQLEDSDDHLPGEEFSARNFRLDSSVARWRPGQPGGPNRSRNCVIMDSNDRWLDISCTARYSYICEKTSGRKPLPPQLEIDYHLEPNILVEGRRFTTICQGYLGLGGDFIWVTSDPHYSALDRLISRQDSFRNLQFLQEKTGRCGYFGNMSLSLTTLPSLDGELVQCCTENRNRRYMSSCTSSDRIRVITDSAQPVLSITFHEHPARAYSHHPIQGTCAAAVGIPGVMFLAIKNSAVEGRWVITNKSRVFPVKPLTGVKVVALPAINDTDNGLVIRAIFRICMRGNFQGVIISCSTQDIVTNMPIYTVESRPLQKRFLPLPPHLDIAYHELPNKLDLNENLKAECMAYVGDYGALVWTLSTWEQEMSWEIRYADPDSLSLGNTSLYWKGLSITHVESFSEDKGPFITSTFIALVTKMFTGANLSCFSHHLLAEKALSSFRPENMVQTSRVFLAMNLPRTPFLDLENHLISAPPIHRWIVTGTCGAVVGDRGSLSWIVRTETWARMWSVNLTGQVTATTLKNLNGIKGRALPFQSIQFSLANIEGIAPNDGNGKPFLKTTLRAEMISSVERITVACYSWDVSKCRAFLPYRVKLRKILTLHRGIKLPPIFDTPLPILVAITFLTPLFILLMYVMVKKMMQVISPIPSEGGEVFSLLNEDLQVEHMLSLLNEDSLGE